VAGTDDKHSLSIYYTIPQKNRPVKVLHGEHILNLGLLDKHPPLHACGVTKKYSIVYLLQVSRTKKIAVQIILSTPSGRFYQDSQPHNSIDMSRCQKKDQLRVVFTRAGIRSV
jgi:hypothetical protein